MLLFGIIAILLAVSFLLSLYSLKQLHAKKEVQHVAEKLKTGRVIFQDSSSSL